MTVDKVAAIVLAAGYSSRMGSLKPLLKIGNSPVLQRVVELFHDGGIGDIIVVLGHRWDEMSALVEATGASWVRNHYFELGMFSSVQVGVKALPDDAEAFFLQPVDIPMVQRQTITELLARYREGEGDIVYPVFNGKRGHPPLISCRYRDEILNHGGDGGLRAVLRRHEDRAVQAHVSDEMILSDMDTPDDYQALVKKLGLSK